MRGILRAASIVCPGPADPGHDQRQARPRRHAGVPAVRQTPAAPACRGADRRQQLRPPAAELAADQPAGHHTRNPGTDTADSLSDTSVGGWQVKDV
jgi:hypothetical protein